MPNIESRCNQLKLGHPRGGSRSSIERHRFSSKFWLQLRIWLNAVVCQPKSVFVGVARLDHFAVRVVLLEVRVIPFFHGNHGVVWRG